jgi:hypothetical protein
LSKLWVDAGHDVRLASRHPDNLLPLIQKLGRRASTGTPAESAQFGDRGKEFEPDTAPYDTGMSGRALRKLLVNAGSSVP